MESQVSPSKPGFTLSLPTVHHRELTRKHGSNSIVVILYSTAITATSVVPYIC